MNQRQSSSAFPYTPEVSSISMPTGIQVPFGNGMAPLPPASNHVVQPGHPYMASVPAHTPSPAFVPPGYTPVVGLQAPRPAHNHILAPEIHRCLMRCPVEWDVRQTMAPPDLPYHYAHAVAFENATTTVTLRFITPWTCEGIPVSFTHVVGSGAGLPLTIADILWAIHNALYTAIDPRTNRTVRRAAEVAAGYRTLRRERGEPPLCRVDMYPVAPNSADGAKLFFRGLEWDGRLGEARVVLVYRRLVN